MKERILYLTETKYRPVLWKLPDDFLSYENFEKCVYRLEMTSNPGIPYCWEAPTNKDWLKYNEVKADDIQMYRLWLDVRRVMDGTYDVHYRSFIKMEPHKITKCESKRWRLIVAAPLSVQVAWHMLFDYQNDLEIKESFSIPSQQGITFYGGDWKRYIKLWKEKRLVTALDKAAWDWTAPYWALEMDLELRYRLARGTLKQQWYEIAKRLYDDMFVSPKIVTTDGQIYQQKYPGIMKSGCVNTISTNSHCQVFAHLLVCDALREEYGPDYEPFPACLGDDTLHADKHTTVEHIQMYKRFGIQVKTVGDQMEFAGHVFADDGPIPTYKHKHLMKLMHEPDKDLPQYINGMMRMYAHHHEMYTFWEDIAMLLGITVEWSRQATLFWYDQSS